MNILITSVSRKVSLVHAFQQALAQEGGGKVITMDINPLSPALYLADEHYIVPRSDDPDFLSVMMRIYEQQEFRLIVPTRDEELLWFAEHKQMFEKVDTRVMVPDRETVIICQDKVLFLRFCRQNNLPIPVSYDIIESPITFDFPVFVKPRFGKGGRQTTRANSLEELHLALQDMPDAIVQEFVHAPEYTIDLFADFSGRIISVVPRRRVHIFGGESFVGRTCKHPALIESAIHIAQTLHLTGHNTIQCFFDGSEVKFIEINPRFGGGANLGFAAGAPTPLYLVKLLKGENLEPRVGKFKDNYVMLRYTEDLFLEEDSLSNRVV